MDEKDLRAFARAWEEAPDGQTGTHYAEALAEAGRIDEAAVVYEAVWDLGYPVGRTELAWLEHDRGHHDLAIDLLALTLPELDDEDRPPAEGVLGHWLWCFKNDRGGEPHLRAGQHAYPAARADLAELLCLTGRKAEGRAVYRAGVEAGEPDSMLRLANLLDEEGDVQEAEALYRRAYELGDPYSAWNLSVMLVDLGRGQEAEEWRWKAAQGGDEFAIRYYSEDPDRPLQP